MAANVKHLGADGATQVTGLTMLDAIAGAGTTPVKLGFQSVSDRTLGSPPGANGVTINLVAVGTNDGVTELRIAPDPVTLQPPYVVTATVQPVASGGAWTTTGTKGFVITALSDIGETIASVEVTAPVGTISQSVVLAWTAIAGAQFYKIYDTDTPGTYTSPSLRATVVGSVTSYTDLGGARAAGAPPVDNRSAGWLTGVLLGASNSGGVWSTTESVYYRVAAIASDGSIIASSLQGTVLVDATHKSITLSASTVPTTAQYNWYRSRTSESYLSPALAGTSIGPSFIDSGLVASTGSLVIAPSYGVPPDPSLFGTASLFVGQVPINAQVFYWITRVVPAATPEVGNPRLATITVREA